MKKMYKLGFGVIALSLITGFAASHSIAAQPDGKQAEAQADEGWEILFDGTSIDAFRGWKMDEFPSKGYRIEQDGSLYAMDGSQDFITRKKYTDFDLRWEWKLSKGANSGVMIHVAEVGQYPHDSGPEYQIIDDNRIHISSTGSLYGLVTPNEKAKINPVGEWNTSRILVHDSKVKHYLNGELVVEYVWGSQYIKEQINKSKFKSWKHFMKQETGHIGFQSHGKDLWFRNIKIKELPEPKPTAAADEGDDWLALFDGTSTDAFRSFKNDEPPKRWVIDDGTLHYTGDRSGGDLVTKQAFTDFDLRWEWKISEAGNSGVKYRVDIKNANNGIHAWGLEYQILDDNKHSNGKNPKTTAGALYSLIAPDDTKKHLKPVGQWNASRIVLKDNNVQHYLNGQLVVEYQIDSDTFKRLLAKSKYKDHKNFGKTDPGHIAFQDHNDLVWYRNIRIRELKDE